MCLEYFNFIRIRKVLFNCFDSCPLNARNHSQKCLSLIIQECSRMIFFISQFQKLHKNVGGTGILSCFYYDLLVKLMKYLLSTNLQVNSEADKAKMTIHQLQSGMNTSQREMGKVSIESNVVLA